MITITVSSNEPAVDSGSPMTSPCGPPNGTLVSDVVTDQAHFPLSDSSTARPAAAMPLLDLAHAAEERGFDCVIVGEHTHIPVSRGERVARRRRPARRVLRVPATRT